MGRCPIEHSYVEKVQLLLKYLNWINAVVLQCPPEIGIYQG